MFAEERIEDLVKEGNEDDQRQGVSVRDNAVGNAMQSHGCCL
jgi:hypothetical protein